MPFDLTEYENTIETQIVKTGVPTEFKFTLFENSGGDSIQHFEFLTNLTEKSQKYSDSDTFIIYDKNDELIIQDPHGLFSNVDFDLESDVEFEAVITMSITFAKAMAQSDIILRVWDSELNSRDTVLKNAIEIIGEDQSSLIEEVEIEELIVESDDSQDVTITETTVNIPEWLKKNAGWWSKGQLDDSTFTNSVQYLIEKQIIDIPIPANVSVDPDDITETEEESVTAVPKWIKINAGWWSAGQIDDETFVMGIQYLVENGIIVV